MKPRWLFRWKVQVYLQTPDGREFGYRPKVFIRRKSAEKFQQKIHQDHGPGMIRSTLY